MEDIDPDALDAAVETERQRFLMAFRRIADRLESMSVEDAIEPITMISEHAEILIRRAGVALRLSLGSPPERPH